MHIEEIVLLRFDVSIIANILLQLNYQLQALVVWLLLFFSGKSSPIPLIAFRCCSEIRSRVEIALVNVASLLEHMTPSRSLLELAWLGLFLLEYDGCKVLII